MIQLAFILVMLLMATVPSAAANTSTFNASNPNENLSGDPVFSFFSPAKASDYLQRLVNDDSIWADPQDTLRLSLQRLLDQFAQPYQTVKSRLHELSGHRAQVEPFETLVYDTLALRWIAPYTFIVDTVSLQESPFIIQKTIVRQAIDPVALRQLAHIPDIRYLLENFTAAADTISERVVNAGYLSSKGIVAHRVENGRIVPPLLPAGSSKSARILPDGSAIVVTEVRRGFRFVQPSVSMYVPTPGIPDSIRLAVNTLLSHNFRRDSVQIFIRDSKGGSMPMWLSAGHDEPVRYWVKNSANDSVTVWVGNPTKYELSLILEDEVIVERLAKREVDQPVVFQGMPARALIRRVPIQERPSPWDILFENSISLNQNFLSNWARGGTGSVSGMIDMNARARYTNPETRVQWTNTGRLRYGAIHTRERGTRTNADLLEFNSQFNTRMFEKIDFSSSMNFRTQVARGFRSPTDNQVVSKFLNPATFIAGLGIEFRPFENTQITFSPLSYRNTFVLDTARINQTLHGIEPGRRSRQEMGGQLMVRSRNRIMEGMTLSNTLRLFSSYLNQPENIDVDWESSLEKQLTWLLSVRLNLHLIYDDDIRFPVLDQAGQPYLLPDGNQKRVAKPQVNQFIGLTFSVRL